MAMEIKTPRGVVSVSKSGKAKLTWSEDFSKRRGEQFDAVQKMVDSEVLRRCTAFVEDGQIRPMTEEKRAEILAENHAMADKGTVSGEGVVKYIAPYARQNYCTNAGRGREGTQNGGLRGKYWFERMKADHKDEIREKSGGKLK